jgi:predicted transcriptional regulator
MTPWFKRASGGRTSARSFGPLEWRVLVVLWDRDDAASVRDLQPVFPETAYTTLMTTLDRLHRKGMLDRSKAGRAFFYRPRFTRPQFESAQVADALRLALEGDGATLRPLLSFFVDAVTDRDRDLLNELELLVRARRAQIEAKRP